MTRGLVCWTLVTWRGHDTHSLHENSQSTVVLVHLIGRCSPAPKAQCPGYVNTCTACRKAWSLRPGAAPQSHNPPSVHTLARSMASILPSSHRVTVISSSAQTATLAFLHARQSNMIPQALA